MIQRYYFLILMSFFFNCDKKSDSIINTINNNKIDLSKLSQMDPNVCANFENIFPEIVPMIINDSKIPKENQNIKLIEYKYIIEYILNYKKLWEYSASVFSSFTINIP